jgi:hypothetical protein
MSRSYRHAPVCGSTTAGSDRWFKVFWHRGLRHGNRQRVRMGQEPIQVRAYVRANISRSQKDGWQVCGPWVASALSRWLDGIEEWRYRSRDEWQQSYERLMRK